MEDISNLIKELSDIFLFIDIPDNLKEVFDNIKNSSENDNNLNKENNNALQTVSNSNSNSNSDFNFDINTILKFKEILDELSNSNDPRKSLLISLKPYLKDNKKDKIDKYVKILSIAKIIELIGPDILGSDNNG